MEQIASLANTTSWRNLLFLGSCPVDLPMKFLSFRVPRRGLWVYCYLCTFTKCTVREGSRLLQPLPPHFFRNWGSLAMWDPQQPNGVLRLQHGLFSPGNQQGDYIEIWWFSPLNWWSMYISGNVPYIVGSLQELEVVVFFWLGMMAFRKPN